jgi:hypothetical protein
VKTPLRNKIRLTWNTCLRCHLLQMLKLKMPLEVLSLISAHSLEMLEFKTLFA